VSVQVCVDAAGRDDARRPPAPELDHLRRTGGVAALLEFAASQPQILRCPNCGAIVVEDAEGIHFFVAATEPPRLYVDRSRP
jgi:hypothetical protein